MNAMSTYGVTGAALMLLVGCGLITGGSSGSTTTVTVPVTTTAQAPTTAAPTSGAQTTSAPAPTMAPASTSPSTTPVPYSDAPTSHEPPNAHWEYQMGDVRVGEHSQYDRVVIEVTGSEASGLTWWAEYSDEPRTQGAGDIVELGGDAVLAVRLQGIAYPPEDVPVLHGVLPNSAHGHITGVYVDPVFEAMVQVFIGVDQQRGFHVTTLESPTRLVIDIER